MKINENQWKPSKSMKILLNLTKTWPNSFLASSPTWMQHSQLNASQSWVQDNVNLNARLLQYWNAIWREMKANKTSKTSTHWINWMSDQWTACAHSIFTHASSIDLYPHCTIFSHTASASVPSCRATFISFLVSSLTISRAATMPPDSPLHHP